MKAVIAESFERIHRSNLIGMGILPLTFINGENATNLEIDGSEKVTISFNPEDITANEEIGITLSTGK